MTAILEETTQAFLDENDILRLTISLLADEIASRTKRSVLPKVYGSWTPETRMDEEGIGLDSLARLDAAIRLNKFFHLHEVGIEDYLLLEETLGGWCRIIAKSLAIKNARVSFTTSGSTGEPKECAHELSDLMEEMHVQSKLYQGTTRIVSLVPPHHIFGLLTTVLLPKILKCDVLDARTLGPGAWRRDIKAGDLVVATPFLWGTLDRCIDRFQEGVTGLSSTAPLDVSLAEVLRNKGLSKLTELYGSTETAGVGYRQHFEDAFELFSHIDRDGDEISRKGEALALQDALDWESPRTFRPNGRKDHAVQVGGVNVFPKAVETLLTSHADVDEAAVRLSSGNNDGRDHLIAFVVPRDKDASEDDLSERLSTYCCNHLKAVSRPQQFTFGDKIPVNAMGKRAAWT